LAVRDEQLRNIRGKGKFGQECDLHIKRCELLARLGRLTAADVDAARETAKPLKKPDGYLRRIDSLRAEGVR
jgi:hypothetical protein